MSTIDQIWNIVDSLNSFQKMRFNHFYNELKVIYEKDPSFRNGNAYTHACFERDLVGCLEAILRI